VGGGGFDEAGGGCMGVCVWGGVGGGGYIKEVYVTGHRMLKKYAAKLQNIKFYS